MPKRPADLLECLRKSNEDEPAPVPIREAPLPEKTVPMVVLRRSQVTVAAVAAGLALILVFLLGLGIGGGDEPEADNSINQGVWGIRVVSYEDTERGHTYARVTQNLLQQLDLDEVTLQRIPSQHLIVVMVGSWLNDPTDNARAAEILAKVQNMSARGMNRAFPDAQIWSIQR